jgi:hypothetical protein
VRGPLDVQSALWRAARGMWLVSLATASACAYVTRVEYDKYWDADGDSYGIDEDCAPDNKDVFPGAGDVRGDGCDADCGFEPDADGDDWPDDVDCDPNDPDVYPCSPKELVGDGRDSDCDGEDGPTTEACDVSDPFVPDAVANVCGGRA